MIQFSNIRHLACAAMFVATGAHAQYNSFSTGPGTAIQVSNGVLGIYMESTPVLVGDLQWSRYASGAYGLSQFTGSYYDRREPIVPNATQIVYAKTMAPSTFTVEANGQISNGAFANELTWTGAANEDTMMTGGSFTLSNLHWNLLSDGSAEILATASGTGITSTDLIAFTTPADAVTNGGGLLTLSRLNMSTAASTLWVTALGANPDGLTYASLMAGVQNGMGILRVGVVPESATWLQMGLGLVGLGALLRRRQRHSGEVA